MHDKEKTKLENENFPMLDTKNRMVGLMAKTLWVLLAKTPTQLKLLSHSGTS